MDTRHRGGVIDGREISVGILGNGSNPVVFPPLEFVFANGSSPFERIRSYDHKWGGQKETMVEACLAAELTHRLMNYTKIAYLACECRDYARMDFRVSTDDKIYFLELNYNPGIGPNTHGLNNTLTKMASFVGLTFQDLAERIIVTAAERAKLI